MLSDLYRRLGYASSPASEVTTRLTAFLNEGLQEVYSEPGLAAHLSLHQPSLTFASVAEQAIYSLPPGVPRIESIRETTNDVTLEMRTRDWYRQVAPDPSVNTGTPHFWIPFGYAAVAQQPSDGSEIFVDSTSGSDTNTAYIEVIRTGGYPRTLSVSMTGTTAVSLSAAITDIVQITKFYLSAAAVGTVTLHEDASGGTELARIPIGQTFARYQQVALYPTPASALTYTVDGERDLPDMSNSNDEPPFPARFHRGLVDYALWKEWEKKDDGRFDGAKKRYEQMVKDLRYHVTCPPDFLPSRIPPPAVRPSYGAFSLGNTNFYSSYVTSDPASPNDGDVWVLKVSDSPLVFRIRTRHGGTNYTLYEVTL